MDAHIAFTLGGFIGLIVGFGLACIRPTASQKEVAQAYEVGVLNGSLRTTQEVSGELSNIVKAARRIA